MTRKSARFVFAGALAVAAFTPHSASATFKTPIEDPVPLGWRVAFVNKVFYCYDEGFLCIVVR